VHYVIEGSQLGSAVLYERLRGRLHSRIARRVAIRIIGAALKLPEQSLRDSL